MDWLLDPRIFVVVAALAVLALAVLATVEGDEW